MSVEKQLLLIKFCLFCLSVCRQWRRRHFRFTSGLM